MKYILYFGAAVILGVAAIVAVVEIQRHRKMDRTKVVEQLSQEYGAPPHTTRLSEHTRHEPNWIGLVAVRTSIILDVSDAVPVGLPLMKHARNTSDTDVYMKLRNRIHSYYIKQIGAILPLYPNRSLSGASMDAENVFVYPHPDHTVVCRVVLANGRNQVEYLHSATGDSSNLYARVDIEILLRGTCK